MSDKLTERQFYYREKYGITSKKDGRFVHVEGMDNYFKDHKNKTYKEMMLDTGIAKPKLVSLKKKYGILKYNYLEENKLKVYVTLPEPLNNYMFSTDFELINKETKQILKPKIDGFGYYVYTMFNTNGKRQYKRLHRLIAENYIPNPLKKDCINHRDGNKLNNSILNLEWCTLSENTYHYHQVMGATDHGENSNWAKISEKQALEIISLLQTGMTQAEVTRQLDFATRGIVHGISIGKTWKHLKR